MAGFIADCGGLLAEIIAGRPPYSYHLVRAACSFRICGVNFKITQEETIAALQAGLLLYSTEMITCLCFHSHHGTSLHQVDYCDQSNGQDGAEYNQLHLDNLEQKDSTTLRNIHTGGESGHGNTVAAFSRDFVLTFLHAKKS